MNHGNDKVAFVLRVADGIDGRLYMVDPIRLQQILSNGISNASKYTDEGEVRLSVFERDGDLVLEVQDSGKGVGKTDPEQLFEMYQQGESNGANVGAVPVAATGLGLGIARQLARAMGGDVTLRNRDDGVSGMVFATRFPAELSIKETSANQLPAVESDPTNSNGQVKVAVLCPDGMRNCLDAALLPVSYKVSEGTELPTFPVQIVVILDLSLAPKEKSNPQQFWLALAGSEDPAPRVLYKNYDIDEVSRKLIDARNVRTFPSNPITIVSRCTSVRFAIVAVTLRAYRHA
jgi:anti-sigma regulatory factor (Ser/Thr protein kinase)